MSYFKFGLLLSTALLAVVFSTPANALVEGEPVISYVSGSGPHPLGTREVEIVVTTDIDAKCRGNKDDTGEYKDWSKYLTSTDNRVHSIRTPLKSDDNIHRYIRCRSINEQVSNTESFAFPIIFANSDTVATPANFTVDRSVSEDGYFTLSWDAVQGAPYLLLKEQHNDGLWNDVTVTTSATGIDLHRPNEGNYLYKVAACSDSGLSDCSAFSSAIAVWVGQAQTGEAPVISYVSGSGPHPYGIDDVEIVVSTNINAVCRGSMTDTGHYDDWKKTLETTDNRLHRVMTSVSGAGDTQRYLRCKATDTQIANTESFLFQITINSPSNLSKPANFKADFPINSGNYQLSWKPVDGAVTYLLKESTDGENWTVRLLDASQTEFDMSKNEDGDYQYYVFACEDELGLDCGPCSDHITVTVSGSSGNNLAPTITSTPIVAGSENVSYQYDVEASDPDAGDVVSFSLINPPSGMEIITESGLISWIPSTAQIGTHAINVVATDLGGLTDTQTFNLVINDVNEAPLITSIAITSATENSTYTYDVEATDGDADDTITYSLTTAPTGMSIVPETGLIEWTPAPNQVQDTNVTVVATDLAGAINEQSFVISVTDVNNAPQITSTPSTAATQDEPYSYQVTATDVDGDALTYSLAGSPQGMLIDLNTGLIEWTPNSQQVGEHNITVSVVDIVGSSDAQSFVVNVTDVDDAPQIISTPITIATEYVLYQYDVDATDADIGDSLTYSLATAPSGMTIDSQTGLISWTPERGHVGDNLVIVQVSDSTNLSDTQEFTISVASVNVNPRISSFPNTIATQEFEYRYQVVATDADGDAITYSLVQSPTGMSISLVSGLITWTPSSGDIGAHTVNIQVEDGQGGVDSQVYTLTVSQRANNAPVITSSPTLTGTVNEAYSYNVTAEDPDNDALSYTLVSAPENMNIGIISGAVTWVPNHNQNAEFSVIVRVEDTKGASTQQRYNLAVSPGTNLAPEIISTAPTIASIDSLYSYPVMATDPEDQAITYYLLKAPQDMVINSTTGLISWLPRAGELGTHEIKIKAKDEVGAYTEQLYQLEVSNNSNSAPQIISSPVVLAKENSAYQYQLEATDADANDTLTYAKLTGPETLTIDSASGLVQWTPDQTFVSAEININENRPQELKSCRVPRAGISEKQPVLKWTFDEHRSTDMLVPVVGPLQDTNQDWAINQEDDAFIAISTNRFSGKLYVYNAFTYELAWSYEEARLIGAGLALGDVDGDGMPELFALVRNSQGLSSRFKHVIAFNGDGSIKWESDQVETTAGNVNLVLGIADIDGDGAAEIYGPNFVINSNGSLRWQVSADDTKGKAETFAADIDLDGMQELAMGPNVYDYQGNLLFSFDEANNDNVILAVSNFDDDPYAEFVVHYNGRLAIAEHDGQITKESTDGVTRFNNVTVADFDGDGTLDIGEGGRSEIWAYNNQAQQLWNYNREIFDSTNFSSASAFDFDGDGASELIVNDENHVFIMNGKDVYPLYQIGSPSVTQAEGHLVVDIDRDNRAELIAYSHGYFSIYEDANDSWPNTRRIWNQHNYMAPMVNDDGSIPRTPITDWNSNAMLKHNPSFLDDVLLADMVVGVPQVEFQDHTSNIKVVVANNGEKQSEVTSVKLYAGSFGQASRLIDEIQIVEVQAGSQIEVQFDNVDSRIYSQELYIVVDEVNSQSECNEDNNIAKAAFVKVEVEDSFGEKDQQSYWVGVSGDNSAPTITSTPITTGKVNEFFEYAVTAEDLDFAERLLFNLEGAPLNFKIDPETGVVTGKPLQGSEGNYQIDVTVSDLEGASSQQSFELIVGISDNQYSPRYTQMPAQVGYEGVVYESKVVAVDDDGDTVSYQLLQGPDGMVIDETSGTITWTPTVEYVGNYWEIVVSANDGQGSYSTTAFYINVLENTVNVPPTIFGQPNDPKIVAGDSYRYTPNVLDPDGDTLTFELTKGPTGVSIIDPAKGTIDWLTTIDDIGSHDFEWTITDEGSNSVVIAFSLHVRESDNSNPSISFSWPSVAQAGQAWSYQTIHSDADGDALTFSLRIAPSGMAIGGATGLLTWTPSNLQVGSHSVEAIVIDGRGGFDKQSYTVDVVRGDNNLPQITSVAPTSANNENEYIYQVEAIDNDQDTLTYDLDIFPTGMTISESGLVRWQPSLSDLGQHNVTVRVEDEFGGSSVQSYVLQVSSIDNHIPEILSQPATQIDGGGLFEYQVTASDADGDSLTFTLASAPSEMTIDQAGKVTWQTDNLDVGDHTIVIRVTDINSAWVEQSFILSVDFLNHLPEISSAAITSAILGNTYQYQVIADDADGDSLTYSLLVAPSSMSIDTANGLVEWPVVEADRGQHTVHLRVLDSRNGYSDQVFYVTADDNNLPVFTSVPSLQIGIDETYQYQAQAVDVDNQVISYSLISGPESMTIDQLSGLVNWNTAGLELGVYQIVIKAQDTFGGEAFQQYNLTLATTSQNSRPEISSAPSNEASVDFNYAYQVIATDVDNDILNYQLLSSPQGMSIDQDGFISWLPELSQLGTQSVSVQVDDGELTVSQTFDISVYAEPLPLEVFVELTPKVAEIGEQVTIQVTNFGGVANKTTSISVEGQNLNVTNGIAHYTPTSVGRYDVEVSVSDDSQSTTTSAYFTVGDDADVEAPFVAIHSPGSHAEITNLVDIVASVEDVNLANYFVALFSTNETLTLENATILAEGETSITSEVVAQFDPTLLTNGLYHIIVQAEDFNGQQSSSSITLQVTGDLKVGNFTISFEDKRIPLAGIPIQVTRTYDSRRKKEALDFGYGWSIDYQNVIVSESSEPTQGWYQYTADAVFDIEDSLVTFPSTCTVPFGEKLVTVTLPNGEVETFVARARSVGGGAVAVSDPNCTLVGGRFINLEFDAQKGTDSELVSLDGQSLYLSNIDNGNLALDIIETEPKDVKAYQLTTRTGFVYILDQYFGIETITDPNGNTLTYSDSGIVHSSGKEVVFVRDAQGRVSSIVDPKGHTISYEYSSAGNLKSVTNEENNTTSFTYNNDHGLLDIIDPLGRNIVKNIYDDSGRLIAQEDKDGVRTEFVHDLAGRQSVVTDRLGNVTTLYYDDEGNVTSQVDALNGVTSFTYDANGNQLSKTDALNRVSTATFNENDDQLTQTDALDNVVSFTYNQRGQELTVTDERDNVFTNSYDGVGNLLSITDPQDNVVSNTINAQGLPILVTDALGNETSYTYDAEGNQLTETNALGHVTSYTYDDNNNVLTETHSRTLANDTVVEETTTFTYDKLNRVITTTNALNQTSTVEYDVVGNQVASIDVLGRRTEMDYDAYGRVIETRFDDGTSDSKTYDVEGNLLSENDRNGNVTSFEYDKLNRLVKTTYADGSFTETEYDAVGQVTAQIDANGHRTEFEYDLAGRRIKTKDALGNEHQFSYDKSGNVLSETDALNRVTSYVYDKLDRKTQTIFANLSTMSDGYDALARKTSATDQAGVATNYAYDALGRLLSVTDVEGNVTRFTYDEMGNKLTQTDAENRTTSWVYDALGRVISRTLPMGQVETTTYDVVGNMQTHIDFNGELKTYTYDSNNRVTLITYAKDGSTESFSYDNNGNRLTATNAEGTWTYTYDVMNRLVSETQPNGDKLEYAYDNNGNKTQLKVTYANGDIRIENSTYDVLNRLKTVTDADGNVTTYEYDAVGNRISVTHSNANVTSYVYDELNRLTQMQDKKADDSLLQQFDYTLHATGRRTKIEELSGRVSDYTYDSLYRLTDEVITDPVNGNYTANYTFDKVGNRTTSTINGVSTVYTYDDNDRLTQEGGEHYTYDDNGNTLTKAIDSDITTYTYDARQKLVHAEITQASVTKTLDYRYNVDGIRNQKIDDGNITHYLVDSNRSYAQVIAETNDTNVVAVEYIFGDDLLAQKRGSTLSNYMYDGLGSTRALTDSTGAVSDSYFYDAFGVELARTGTTENDYLFTGEQYDAGLGNYYLRARYYDQNSGRFTQQDTWMGRSHDPVTLHKYLYANADPVTYTDPTGNFGITELSVTNNIVGILTEMQIDNGINVFDTLAVSDASIDTARTAQKLLGLAMLGAGGVKIFKMLSNKFRKATKGIKCNSFYGDTLVHTSEGLKPISEISIGDMVWSYDENTQEKSLQEVVHLIQGEGEKTIVDITLQSGEVIRSTGGHPFYDLESGRWMQAKDLSVDDKLLEVSGAEISINAIDISSKNLKVFNITVDNLHTYYVGKAGVLNHNESACEPKWDWTHIFAGSGGGGVHHAPSVGKNFEIGKELRRKGDWYEAEVWRTTTDPMKLKHGGFSTFFPDSMSQEQIKAILWAAALKTNMKGGTVVASKIWPGAPAGVSIKVFNKGAKGWGGFPVFD